MSYSADGILSSLPRTTRGFSSVLGADPKGKTFIYTNGNSVIIRNADNPSESDVYTEHAKDTTVAKYSPSGFYIASADITGKVRVWDTTQKEHILKIEHQPLGGTIRDLCWSSDNQRIAVGGEGREKFGHVFTYDAGNSVGEVSGPTKPVTSVDLKPTRPFRLVVASEDFSVTHLQGPPFKFDHKVKEHTRFVNCVRYAPNGESYASAAADGRLLVHDGKTGLYQREIGSPAHQGGIYGVRCGLDKEFLLAWSVDGTRIATCGGDKMVKVFDFAEGTLVRQFRALVNFIVVAHHQLISTASRLRVYHRTGPGHNKPLTAMASAAASGLVSASSDGVVCGWNDAGVARTLRGEGGHTSQVEAISIDPVSGVGASVSIDSKLAFFADGAYLGPALSVDSPSRDVSSAAGLVAVATDAELLVFDAKSQALLCRLPVSFGAACVALKPDASELAVGAVKDNKLRIYSVTRAGPAVTLTESRCIDQSAPINRVAYSPNAHWLATANQGRRVRVYRLPEYESVVSSEWTHHKAKVNAIAWSPDSQRLATGALDTNVMIWRPDAVAVSLAIPSAHPMSQVTGVAWLSNVRLASAGQDACIRFWRVK